MGLDSRNGQVILNKGNEIGHPETLGQYDIEFGELKSIAFGDIDQDGTPDAIVGNGGQIIVIPLTPDGPKEEPWPSWSARSDQLCVADFNNDGNLDCLAAGRLTDKSETFPI